MKGVDTHKVWLESWNFCRGCRKYLDGKCASHNALQGREGLIKLRAESMLRVCAEITNSHANLKFNISAGSYIHGF